MTYAMQHQELWSIILAGGEGERLRPFVQHWLGRHKPKQYCTFIGTRSMFQHTVDRADQLSSPERKVIIIARSHRREVSSQLADRPPGKLLVQPANRDTAVGAFLGLTYVRACNPQATVVLYPSDHFVYPEEQFAKVVRSAVRTANLVPDHLVLLAALPDRIELEYGWIQPGQHIGWAGEHRLWGVEAFLEKPDSNRAMQAMLSGGLWSTLVLAAKVEALWEMGWRCFPEAMDLFEKFEEAIGTSEEDEVLEAIYNVMPTRNFSSHLLQCVPDRIAAIEMNGMIWSDWGKPERIVDTIGRIDSCPKFPLEHIGATWPLRSENI